MTEVDFSTPWEVHGRIVAATIASPDLKETVASYARGLKFQVVADNVIDSALAAHLAAPTMVGRRSVLLAPENPRSSVIRIVEGDRLPEGYGPLRTFGWGALEIAVCNVMEVHDAVAAAGFRIINVPKDRQFSAPIRPMQCAGVAGEVFFLTEIRGDSKNYFFPRPESFVDQLFIVILSSPDRRVAQAFYDRNLGFPFVADFNMPYPSLNQCMGLPAETVQSMTMVRAGHRPAIQIDQMPELASPRASAEGGLPPGIASVSFLVDSLDAVKVPFLSPIAKIDGAPYNGRRSACIRGSAGELIELIELHA